MRQICEGSLFVPLPPARAAELFTPDGERAWAPGWAPEYPGEAGGPVFTTHDEATVWIALGDLRYARVTPGVSAGTVAVRCEPEGDGTRARVTYDLTALSDTADLAGLAREFGARMESWERMIAATL